MRIFVFGTRGFPDIQGGVEQHCENLYPLLASEECLITVFRRRPYIGNWEKTYPNIRFIDLPSTRIEGFETLYHSFLCTVISVVRRPDIVHIHNIGPGFFVPVIKAFGLKAVMTYHSPNYEHQKWPRWVKQLLKLSEYLSAKFSDKIIFVSAYQKEKLGNFQKFVHINNGVKLYPPAIDDSFIRSMGLEKRGYVLAVGRLTEEKGFDLLVRAFAKIRHREMRLVIAGDADHETSYSARLKELAKANNVILTGFVRGEKLQQLYSHTRLFVIPSYNEGLPISLLEAMSYKLPVLCSDIKANLQVALPGDNYFRSGDEFDLAAKLDFYLDTEFAQVTYDMSSYCWENIAQKTKSVFDEVLEKKK